MEGFATTSVELNRREQKAMWEPVRVTIISILHYASFQLPPHNTKGTQVALQGCRDTGRGISMRKITIWGPFRQTSTYHPGVARKHSRRRQTWEMQTVACVRKTEQRQSQGSVRADLYSSHVPVTSSAMSFKSSLTLTTPKERKEAWWYYGNLHFYVAKSINLY